MCVCFQVSTRSKDNQAAWAGPGVLAIATGETTVRIWDLKTDDNYVLPSSTTAAAAGGGSSLESITSLSFCEERNVLAAGTNSGHVLMWKYPAGQTTRPLDDDWRAMPRVHVGPTVRSVSWGGTNRY